LGDILVSHRLEGQAHVLVLAGSRAEVRAYLRLLQKLERRSELIIHGKTLIHTEIARQECKLPLEVIELMAKALPDPPWPKNIHKTIAQRFAVSNKQAWAAIDVILNNQRLTSLIGTSKQIPGEDTLTKEQHGDQPQAKSTDIGTQLL
jgi:hypothetical protein